MKKNGYAKALTLGMLGAGLLVATSANGSRGGVELVDVRRIWDEAPHNAFTDLIRFNGVWVCGFREAPAHAGGVTDSRIRVVISENGNDWSSTGVLVDERGDVRDAKFAVMPDGRLMLLTAIQKFDTTEYRHQSLVWFTSDLENWDGPHDVGERNVWLWGITWHEGVGYSIGYSTGAKRFVRLYTTDDGLDFRVHVEALEVDDPYPNESKIIFDDHGRAHCLLRGRNTAHLGTAEAPYKDWTWTIAGQFVGGPELIQLPDGRFIGGGRAARDFRAETTRTALFEVDFKKRRLTRLLDLPSAGDSSYPGFVWHEGKLWVSYYSSHEGKSNIYLAQVEFGSPNTDED